MPARRDFYCFNATIAGIDEADAMLIVGSNPRREAPVLNARIRKRWLHGKLPVGLIGEAAELTYDADQLGDEAGAMSALHDGSATSASVLASQEADGDRRAGRAARPDGAAVLAAAWELAAPLGALTGEWHGFNVLHTAAARVGALDLGFLPGPGGRNLRADAGRRRGPALAAGRGRVRHGARSGRSTFVVYQGHHGDRGAARADVILPGAAYTEKNGT